MKTIFSADSDRFYKDGNGFVYKKTKTTKFTINVKCNNINCNSNGKLEIETLAIRHVSDHLPICVKPCEHSIRIIELEEEIRQKSTAPEYSRMSGLLIYKEVVKKYDGMLIPIDFKAKILLSIRNHRKYMKTKQKDQHIVHSKSQDKPSSVNQKLHMYFF